jgi:hypothetical protein
MVPNPALAARITVVAEEPWRGVFHRTLQAVADALGRLLPPPPLYRGREIPPEWFKYPPI